MMNTENDANDANDGRPPFLSGRARAAIILLAVAVLAAAGALSTGPSRPDEEPLKDAVAAAPERPAAPARPAAARKRAPRRKSRRPSAAVVAIPAPMLVPAGLALPPDREGALRDEQLKDAVGDFRLLEPKDDPHQHTTTVIPSKGGGTRTDFPSSWTGLYAGVNLGGASGVSALRTSVEQPGDYFLAPDIAQLGDLGSVNSSPSGVVGGAQIGFGLQCGRLVYGLEADVNAMPLSGSRNQSGTYNSSPANTFSLTQSVRTDWLATVRPRLGVALGRLLLYGTGGLALTRFKYDEQFVDTFSPALARESFSETRMGWTLGGGGEFALREHWSLKAEYLYADFGKLSETSMLTRPAGKKDVFDHSATFNVHLVRLGLNYRF